MPFLFPDHGNIGYSVWFGSLQFYAAFPSFFRNSNLVVILKNIQSSNNIIRCQWDASSIYIVFCSVPQAIRMQDIFKTSNVYPRLSYHIIREPVWNHP